MIKKISTKIPKLKIIVNKKNIGVAKSRNIALKKSKGDYIAFLDGFLNYTGVFNCVITLEGIYIINI